MTLQQKVADMHAMMEYIKNHLDADPQKEDLAKLDEIEASVCAVKLQMEQYIKGDDSLEEYKQSVNSAADVVIEQMKEITTELINSQISREDTLKKVKGMYDCYEDTLREQTKKLQGQEEQYEKEVQSLKEEIQNLSKTLTETQDKQVEYQDKQMEQYMESLKERLDTVAKQDEDCIKICKESIATFQASFDVLGDVYKTLNENLKNVEATFTKTADRLETLLSQGEPQKEERKRPWQK